MATYQFMKQGYHQMVFEQTYPDRALGWSAGVYYPRHSQNSKPVDSQVGPVTFTFYAFEEDSEALNGDQATIGHFEYLNGTRIQVTTKAINYQVDMIVKNPGRRELALQAMVNELPCQRFNLAGGETKTISFEVALTKRHFNLTFRNESSPKEVSKVQVLELDLTPAEIKSGPTPTIYIASDSTAQTYDETQYPQSGWGAHLYQYLMRNHSAVIQDDPTSSYPRYAKVYRNESLTIVNKSIGGRSSKSFIQEGKLAELVKTLRPRDYLLIQWGDNDATQARPMRYVSPRQFPDYLSQYIQSALDRQAIPILITPPSQYSFTSTHRTKISFNDYRQALLDYARNNGIDVIDLGLIHNRYISELGMFKSQALYMKLPAGAYRNFPAGLDDKTHFRELGAVKLAGIVASELCRFYPQLPFFAAPQISKLATPTHLTATIVSEKQKRRVDLAWDAVAGADFYTVVKKSIDGTVLKKAVVTKPSYADYPELHSKGRVRYRVVAHHDLINSQSAVLEMTYPFNCQPKALPSIEGLNLYEVDRKSDPNKVAFSLRFKENPQINSYQIVLRNLSSGKETVLDHFSKEEFQKLHSYQIDKHERSAVLVVGRDMNGRVCSSKPLIFG